METEYKRCNIVVLKDNVSQRKDTNSMNTNEVACAQTIIYLNLKMVKGQRN